MKKKGMKKTWNLAKDKVTQNVSMDKVQQYGEAFEKIQTATGIQDIDELVTNFVDAEDKNFSLFNYINEMNQEIEKLEEHIEEIRGEIETYKAGGVVTDTMRKKELKNMEEKLQRMEAKADLYEKKYEEAMKTVNTLKAGVWNIFNKIGCNTPSIRELLGEGNVTEANLMQYLGVVEQRSNELLQAYATVERWAGRSVITTAGQAMAAGSPGPKGAPTGGLSTMRVDPPSTNDEELDSDGEVEVDDEKPLNREALETKVQKSIAKRGDRIRTHPKPATKK